MISDKLTALYIKSSLLLDRLIKDQRGVITIEYALVAVAVASIVGVAFTADGSSTLKGALQGAMQRLAGQLTGSGGS